MSPRTARTVTSPRSRSTAARTRAPEATRERLVAAAFEEIHRHGYRGAGLDTILATAGVTKGALYHHFDDKADLAHAVIDEVIRGLTLKRWTGPLASYEGDPISGLQLVLDVVSAEFCDDRFVDKVELGCPLNNIAQEMSPLDERFRRRVAVVFETWIESFAQALERGRADGTVRRDVDARKVATFVVSSIEGSFGLAKNAKSAPLLRENFEVLKEFLETLRDGAPPKRVRRTVNSRR
jgi:AcrR family transcriptional regulator